jgi:hypothetical protein
MRLFSPRAYAVASIVALFVWQAGCAAAEPASGADPLVRDAAEGATSAAIVVFERVVGSDGSARASAVGRFLKMRAGSLDDQALRMVGATLDLPPLGTCAATSAAALPSAAASQSADWEGPRALELLDVGALTVDVRGVHTTLEARALPDIVDLVTGVLYSTRVARDSGDGLPSRGSYLIRSAGSSDSVEATSRILPFEATVTAPGEPDQLRIAGQAADGEDAVALAQGAAVELTWAAFDTGDPDDLVYVDVLPSDGKGPDRDEPIHGGDASPSARCVFSDRGQATVPASAFAADDAATPASEILAGTLLVHRVHREALTLSGPGGFDSGVVRFDFARAVEFSRR